MEALDYGTDSFPSCSSPVIEPRGSALTRKDEREVSDDKGGIHVLQGSRHRAADPHISSSRTPSMKARSGGSYGLPKGRRGDLEAALRAMEQRLATLIDDRNQLARDLHDCVLQSLYAIGLNLERTRRSNDPASSGSHHPSDLPVTQLNSLIQEIRGMIGTLQSGAIHEFDLASELGSVIGTYQQSSRLQIHLDVHAQALSRLTHEEKQDILMIVREALSNCTRHANASRARVTLHAEGSRIRLLVSDNGAGFTQGNQPAKGYGLANMAARAKRLGGRLSVRSQVGFGTQILAEFLLEPMFAPL